MSTPQHVIAQVFEYYGLEDESTKAQLIDMAEEVKIDNGQILQRVGEVTDAFYLIIEGVVRYFYNLEVGKERNKAFFKEGQFIGSLSAFYTDKVIHFTIEALEPCRLLRFPYAKIPFKGDIERILQGVTRDLFIRNELREATLLTGSAEERYIWVEANEPWLLDRIPQYHLASYLRLEPVSLSRVKSKLSKG